MALTAKELAAIEAQLDEERLMIRRYAQYARLACDPQLKARFEHHSKCHQNCYDRLRARLG